MIVNLGEGLETQRFRFTEEQALSHLQFIISKGRIYSAPTITTTHFWFDLV